MAITATERTQIVELTTLMFNAAPGATYLSQIVALYEGNGRSLSTLAAQLAQTSVYNSLNPAFQTSAEFATKFLTPLGLQNDAIATDFVVSRLNSGATKASVVYAAFQALNGLATTDAAIYQTAKTILLNKTTVAEYYSATLLGSATDLVTLQNVISAVTADAASVTAAQNALNSVTGQALALTSATDNIVGTAANDTITAGLSTTGAETLTAFDSVDGGAGSDTFNVFLTGAHASVPAVTVKNVEAINITDDNALTANITAWGGNSVSLTQVGTAAAQDITVAAASVSVKGGTTVAVTDGTTAATALTSVSVDGNGGKATLTGKGIATVSLANTAQAADIVNATASGKGTLTLNVNKVTGGAVIADTKDNYSTVNVTASGSKASNIAFNAATNTILTAATLGGAAELTFATNATKLATVTVTGSGGVVANLSATGTTSVDASASSGTNSITIDGTAATFKGGSGSDTVLLAAAPTKAIDGGTGSNTLSLAAIADLTTLSKTSLANATNFQTLQLTGAVGTAADAAKSTLDVGNLPAGMVNVALNTSTDVENLTFKNVASGFTFTELANQAKSSTITLKTDGTSDVLNLVIGDAKSAAITLAAGVVATTFETVNVTANADTSAAAVQHAVKLTDATATALTVNGNAGVDFTGSTLTAVSTVSAGGSTGAIKIDLTGGVTTGVTVTTGSGADTITTVGATGKVDTINSGTGNDSITTGAGNDVITAGGGNATVGVTISAGAGTNTITVGGSGISSITVGDGKNTITGGSGADTINVGSGANSLTLGAGKDVVVFTKAAASSAVFTTVSDLAAGDVLNFAAIGAVANADGKLGAALVSGVNDYQTFLNAAAGKAAGTLSWFQFGGDTYIVEEAAGNAVFDAGADHVVKIVGLFDLSNSVVANAAETLTIV